MMTEHERAVMMQALEALNGTEALLVSMGVTHPLIYGEVENAITALRVALANHSASSASRSPARLPEMHSHEVPAAMRTELHSWEKAVLGTPHPSDFGIPKKHWEAAQYYANYWHENRAKAQPPEPTQEPVSKMTAGRAVYFMERFKREEKLLGPNEQAALDFVISMLQRQTEPLVWEPVVRDLPALTQREYDALHSALRWNYKKIAQPQRQSLTDKEITDAWCDTAIKCQGHGWSVIAKEFARVIERKVRE